MRRVEFGLGGISCQRFPGAGVADVELYRQALQLVALAEETGFDSAWVAEHHFSDDAFMPSGLLFCTAAAMRTSRITLGTAVLLAPLYHPLRLAEDAATVDLLSQGRFVLGLGLGYVVPELEAFGLSPGDRAAALERVIPLLRRAWAGELVDTADLQGSRSGTRVVVTPQPTGEGRPRIWAGGQVEGAVRRAGALADGFVATYVADPMVLKRQADWARAGAESAGRDPSQLALAVSVPVFAWEDGVAWDVVQESYHYLSWKYEDLMSWRDRSGSPLPAPSLTTERRQAIRKDIVVGTPEQVTEQVGDLVEAAGGSLHFIARLYFPGLEPSVQEEAVRIFADRVAKVLR